MIDVGKVVGVLMKVAPEPLLDDEWRTLARAAALEVIRQLEEPSAEMIEAGGKELMDDDYLSRARKVYCRMMHTARTAIERTDGGEDL